jgi:hypothetical protein
MWAVRDCKYFFKCDKYSNPIAAYFINGGGIQLMRWDSGTLWKNEGIAVGLFSGYSIYVGTDGFPVVANSYAEGKLSVKKYIIR